MKYLFEVSWEVCNKVGGIHTVIATKAEQALAEFGDAYITIGPDLNPNNLEFEETDEEFFHPIKSALATSNLKCRFGRWRIPGRPRAILITGFQNSFNIDRLLFAYWEQYGVDSYEGGWDYIEPIMFSTAAAEIIELITKLILNQQDSSVAHFHEWMCGSGILYLKKNVPQVGTVFSTHATVLGRAMAHTNHFYYHEMSLIQDTLGKAHRYGVKSKHSLEAISAREADCFTTVSEFTAREAGLVLSKRTDLVVYNGLNFSKLHRLNDEQIQERKAQILNTCSQFFEERLPSHTQVWISSGRYEYTNKGYDLILESLAELKRKHHEALSPVVVLFLIAADRKQSSPADWVKPNDPNKNPIAISPVYNPQEDLIINACKRLGLDDKNSPIKVVLSTLYLDGHDGIFNIQYDDVLASADLSLFPSFYEPWGYTPLESAALGVPTITSDLSGFGHWVHTLDEDFSSIIKVLPRRNRSKEESSELLSQILWTLNKQGPKNDPEIPVKTKALAKLIDWQIVYQGYKAAYDIAAAKGYDRELSSKGQILTNPFEDTWCSYPPRNPCLYSLGLNINLPEQLRTLNKLAYNLYWSWNDDAKDLFKSINPKLWEYFDHNPIKLLRSIPYRELEALTTNNDFMSSYQAVKKSFKNYIGDTFVHELVDSSKPIVAYFSMEYGLHESLPIYSGGLGVLSGDHVKAASDQNLDMIAIGIYYNQGYFVQEINGEGRQIEHYSHLDWQSMPLKLLLNQSGEPVKIPVEILGRTIWTRVLIALVGRVPLFLFDTNIDENNSEDKLISSRLYVGDRKTRILQETLVGIAGIRLIKDVLNVNPVTYHLNEGHCAFLSVELIRRLTQQGYSFETAVETIKSNTVFTTHTPVPAGNEAFDVSLVQEVFSDFFNTMHQPIQKLINLGKDDLKPNEFSMTILALRISNKANGVSALHGEVSRKMWGHVIPNVSKFLGHVTNGVHLGTWMGRSIKSLYFDENLASVSNEVLWTKHIEQKNRFITEIKQKITDEYMRKGMQLDLIKKILKGLNKDTLLIGFARRFATYKRSNLIFSDIERLKTILSSSSKPVILIFAGKAHPADGVGKDNIQSIFHNVIHPDLMGNLILIENYNMYWGSLLTQGVDVWLNNPIMEREACGTSGMKAAINGVLNLSIPDGWWYEGYDSSIGWSIPYYSTDENNLELINQNESQNIYNLLEKEVVPLYYRKDANGIPHEWVEMMRASIIKTTRDFGADRMIRDYCDKFYANASLKSEATL